MAAVSDTNNMLQYHSVLQSLLSDVQSSLPSGQSTSSQQQSAVANIATTYSSESTGFKDLMQSSLDDKVGNYVEITHKLNDYNEIYNTNKYIDNELTREKSRMNDLIQKLKNKIYISKQKSQMYEYNANRLKFNKGFFLFCCSFVINLLALAAALLANTISYTKFYVSIAIITIIYISIIVVLLYANSYRTHTDWNKFHWGSIYADKATGKNKCK
jgi:hypothetical protein